MSLHRFDPADAEGFLAMNADPEVMRFTGDPPFASLAQCQAFLRDYDHYRRHDFGRWTLYLSDGRYAGFCGLRHCEGEVDLGFRLPRALWGQGLAGEAARLSLQLAFAHYRLDKVVGRARCENQASLRLLARLGFSQIGEFEDQHGRWQCWELSQKDWLKD
ncbi:GNAT family N-acetyltransferase [Ferrimonas marina]|uniref:GNAT family N-acetyltransferase n=1 Tax=Ferrimonas marina TaxID=299255 RepID=UPI001356555B|nr:GNAT family N-acetyltransferase [Ferrimonas marina]